jgi:predicted porin
MTMKNRYRSAITLIVMLSAFGAALSAQAQTPPQPKTGPVITGDDSLTWHGITLYGVIDIGVQYDTHSAPFTPYRPSASGNIIRSNGRESVIGITPSNIGQSRVGLQGVEPLNDELSAVFQIETFFNPQSGQIADALRSLTSNNGKAVTAQNVGVDGSSAGQAFQTAYAGLKSAHFGTLTFGRQVTLLAEGANNYDPNHSASAFGLIGASNTYAGGGSSEDNRLDSTVKYTVGYADLVHAGVLYKFNTAGVGSDKAVQANVGAAYAGAAIDAYYSKVNSAITASALSVAQVAALPLGFSLSNSLAATVSDNTTYALMAQYKFDPLRFFAGYLHIKYANPDHPLSAGFTDIGGYSLAVVTNNAFNVEKTNDVYWTGVRYTIIPRLDLIAAYYHVHQNAFGTGAAAGCSTAARNTCSGNLETFSFDADFRVNKHFDAYLGAMYSGIHDGLASGYLFTTNINPTVGVRYRF